MQEQIKQSIVTQIGENPQFSSTLMGKKIKQHSKKKKEFKIKKTKLNGGKKNRKQEGFSDPIYAGLDTDEMENDNRLNFGPWMRQGMNAQNLQQKSRKFNDDKFYDRQFSDRIQNSTQNINDRYQSQSRHNRTLSQDLRMLQTKKKRQFHQLRCSSLMLQIAHNKSVTLSPIKPLKIKQSQLNKNTKSKLSSIQLLKYNSMKYLFANNNSEKQIDSNNILIKKPNAVIYNYCCSTYDNNLFGNDIDNLLLNRKSNKTPVLNDLKQQFKQKTFRNTFSKQAQTLLPIKKSISRQLYDQLIKKKSKLK